MDPGSPVSGITDAMSSDPQSAIHDPRSTAVVIALGSNLGDSIANVRAAMDELEKLSTAPLLRSSLWRSTPVECPPGSPLFINAVVALTPAPEETPKSLLGKLQSIERAFGRQPKSALNEPRPIDLDLITWGNEMHTTPALTLPHPRAHLRRFVLAPLAEVAPELVLPGRSQPVSAALAQLFTDEQLTRLG